MHNVTFALDSAWRVLLTCLILGAGLPILFAAGIRALAWSSGGEPTVTETGVAVPAPRPAGKVLAYACFTVVVLAVLLGITFIVASGFGKAITFDHVIPTLIDK
ncbi:hypothetical protein [Actinoplanes sp. NBRC 103695]|uniref:hypothetical protein n=1 Tax=Actinoplanes sp. NBRC 103695 TaxID=3032202 RepID=UPI0024A58413|nr:hypothetical protein [Actinoplanes sp. NBRC 103695]GLY98510.1 hypothetical protein Acsp02_57640 [Actinoplanes sp. NBRC 103695]